MKPEHKIFFAIPFDSATKKLYERVRDKIRETYPSLNVVIGTHEVGPSPKYSEFASFKAQNRELTKQFVDEIRDADVVVADLTHNNPNVHVELGIALTQNKNVLRVTGRSFTELGFDIRNLKAHAYEDEEQLTETVINYLKTFFEIKQLEISKKYPALYCEEPLPIELRACQSHFDSQSNCPSNFVIRDGAFRVKFEFLRASDPDDYWFGVYFRVVDSSFMGSHLLHVRQNGTISVAIYPGPHPIEIWPTGRSISSTQELTAEFENNYLAVQMGESKFQTDRLYHQTAGRLLPAAWNADVNLYSAEIINRDTID